MNYLMFARLIIMEQIRFQKMKLPLNVGNPIHTSIWSSTRNGRQLKAMQLSGAAPSPPEFRMTKKPGPKPKLDTKMRAAAKQYLLRDPDLSNTSIAQKLETKRQ